MLWSNEAPGGTVVQRRAASAHPRARPIATWPELAQAIVDAWSDGLAGCRDYERLRSHGVPHGEALREAFGLTASPPLDPVAPQYFPRKA